MNLSFLAVPIVFMYLSRICVKVGSLGFICRTTIFMKLRDMIGARELDFSFHCWSSKDKITRSFYLGWCQSRTARPAGLIDKSVSAIQEEI